MDYKFADCISTLQPSLIREFFKYNGVPGIIPFSAGNPSTESFPAAEIAEIAKDIFADHALTALQYGITEGYAPLRETLRNFSKERYGIGTDGDELIITSGSQQTMYLATKVLVNPGDTVICEEPSFVGSLNAFRSFGANLCGVPVDSDGINIEKLEEALKTQKNVRFIYTIPNFQNPSGITMSLEKRKAVYELAKKYGVMILEDNPYGELRVTGEDVPQIKSLDTDGIVIYAGSFSKILAPGVRVGYCVAPAPVVAKMTVGKQVSDVHTPVFSQILVDEWMKRYDIDEHINKIRDMYRSKLNLMCDLVEEKLLDYVTYTRPEGGLFVWCKLNDNIPMAEYCRKALDNKVTIVPGSAFLGDMTATTQCFRMNFSTPSDEAIVKGVNILADIAKEY